jgi:PAS domain S-box-containing protein
VTIHDSCNPIPASVACSQRLIEALGRLQQTTHAIRGSIYLYDLIEQRNLYTSSSTAALLGYTADAIQAMEPIGLANLIHPDDLHAVSDHYQRFTTLKTGEVIVIEYRMKRADGIWVWLRSQETPLVQAIDGFPLQLLGIIEPLTQLATTFTIPPNRFKRSLKRYKTVRRNKSLLAQHQHLVLSKGTQI